MKLDKVSVVLILGLVSSATAAGDYRWNAVEGVFDGDFTNVLHWIETGTSTPADHVPGASGHENENAVFHTSEMGTAADGYTVVYPKGDFTNSAGLTFALERGAAVTVDGTETRLVYPRPADGMVRNNGFNVGMGQGGANTVFSYDFNSAQIHDDLFDFRDFRFVVTNSPHERLLLFDRGSFSFLSGAYVRFFFDETGVLPTPVVEVAPEADVSFSGVIATFYMPSDENRVRVRGGRLDLNCAMQLPVNNVTGWFKETPQLLELSAVEGGELLVGQDSRYICFGSGKSVGTASATIRILADGARLVQNYRAKTTSLGKGRHEIIVRNGSTALFNGQVHLGNHASATGVVSIADSEVAVAYVRDGEWILGGTTAEDVAAGAWGELNVERSSVSLTNSIAVTAGRVEISDSDLVFGAQGVMIYSRDSQGGTSSLDVDGVNATLHPDSSEAPFTGFTTACIGAKGLSIETAGDITSSQPFTDKPGEAGVLTLEGAGTKTLSGDISVSKVEILDGDVGFAGRCTATVVATNGAAVSFGGMTSAEFPLAGLHLGSAASGGVLKVSPGEKIYLADGAALTLSNLRLVVSGGVMSPGDTVSLVCAGDISSEARAAWCSALVEAAFGDGYTWNVRESALPGGGTEFIMESVQDDPIVIAVPEGATEIHSTGIVFSTGMTLKTMPGAGATLDLRGTLGYGRLWQAQGGRTAVSGSDNLFAYGIRLDGGVLHFAGLSSLNMRLDSPLVLNGGVFSVSGEGVVNGVPTVNTATKETPMVFRTDGDVEMAMPDFTQGKCLKTGEGRLTFTVDGDRTFTNMGWNDARPLAVDEVNGVITKGNGATFDVGDGTLVLKGTGPVAPKLTIYNANIVLGGDTGSPDAGPVALEIDHLELYAGYNNNRPKTVVCGRSDAVPGRTSASVTLRNGALLGTYEYEVGENLSVTTTVDASTLKTSGNRVYFSASGSGTTIAGTNFWKVTNGGKVYVDGDDGPLVYAPGVYEFDRGTLAKNAAGEPTRMRMVNPIADSCQQFFLRNRSYFAVSYFGVFSSNQTTVFNNDSQRYELTFDDSEWFAGAGERSIASSNMIVTVTVTGGGLRMNPPADSVWTLYTRVDGDAGLAKGGAGVMIVDRAFRKHGYMDDPVTLAYDGRTTVTGGTLRIVSGACAHHVYGLGGGATLDLDGAAVPDADVEVVGDGTLVNASVTGLTLRPRYADGTFAQVTFGSGVSLGGRTLVDFGRTAADPLPTDITGAVVGRWTGAKPDAGRWRGVNTGHKDFRFVFAARDDGTITADCVRKGRLLIVIR